MNTASCELIASTWIPQSSYQAVNDRLVEQPEMVRVGMSQGIPLYQLEAYLDWLDAVRQAGKPKR